MEGKKILSAIGVGVLLVGATALAVNKIDSTGTQAKIDSLKAGYEAQLAVKPTEVIKTVEVPKEVIKEVPGPEVVKEVIKEVDSPNLGAAMDFIHDNLNSDITINYIVFETNAHIEAEAYINNDFKTLLDDENYFDDNQLFGDFRKSEVSVKKIYDPIFEHQDYDRKSVDLTFKVKIHAEKDKDNKLDKYFLITVPFDKGVLQDSDVTIEETQ